MIRRYVWAVARHGYGTKALKDKLAAGWEPFGFSAGMVALRKKVLR